MMELNVEYMHNAVDAVHCLHKLDDNEIFNILMRSKQPMIAFRAFEFIEFAERPGARPKFT